MSRNRGFCSRNLVLAAVAVAVLAVAAPVAVSAQTPSLYVPLSPCRLFDSRTVDDGLPFAAGSTHYLLTRGSCSVPQAANAVAMTVVAFNPAGSGNAKVWESSATQPVSSSFNFRSGPGSDSSFLLSQLCYPVEECAAEDLAIYVSQQTHVIVDVVGYTVPMPPSDPFPVE